MKLNHQTIVVVGGSLGIGLATAKAAYAEGASVVIDTPMLDRVFGEQKLQVVETIAAKLPVERIGTPQEVADAVLFLMGNGFVTGTTLLIDGGDALV